MTLQLITLLSGLSLSDPSGVLKDKHSRRELVEKLRFEHDVYHLHHFSFPVRLRMPLHDVG
jgi:hypothetical protein